MRINKKRCRLKFIKYSKSILLKKVVRKPKDHYAFMKVIEPTKSVTKYSWRDVRERKRRSHEEHEVII